MNKSETIITFGSWEDRFRDGFSRILGSASPRNAVLFCFSEYRDWSAENRATVQLACQERQVHCSERVLSVATPADNWHRIATELQSSIRPATRVLVDLTTMPREIIWTVFWMLDAMQCEIDYSYFRPLGYGAWLSREPLRPRLVYKLSGISRLQARTALVVLAGYDADRTKQLMSFFEPEITLLGLQTLDMDPSNDERMVAHKLQAERLSQDGQMECFFLNAYAADCGQARIEEQIARIASSHNIVMSSLGPKLSAVSLYRLHRTNREIALAYSPSKEFNRGYSHGIGEGVFGAV